MLPSFMNRPYVRLRYPFIEDHGNRVYDYTAEPDRATFRGSVQPGAGTTDRVNREGYEIVKTIWGRPGADVRDRDRISLPSGDYFVNGAPEPWDQGVLDHVVIHLSEWRG